MPVTEFQRTVAKLLAANRSADSHLAGGAALHFAPNSKRFSDDLDYFQDSVERVAESFASDRETLESKGYKVAIEMNQPGYIRAAISKAGEATKVEWAHDSAWRFMPALSNADLGFQLHPIDLAVNKVLALAGRDEARDFLDIVYIDQEVLSLGPLCWAAVGKDPGFSPLSLIELLKRRGKYRAEDFERLRLSRPVNLTELKTTWLAMLERAEQFVRAQPASELGCLYYSKLERKFVDPQSKSPAELKSVAPHYGQAGGVLPKFYDGDSLADLITARDTSKN